MQKQGWHRFPRGKSPAAQGARLGNCFDAFSQRWFKPDHSGYGVIPLPHADKEIQEKEYLNLPRLVMNFNMHDYGRLCEMIRVINRD